MTDAAVQIVAPTGRDAELLSLFLGRAGIPTSDASRSVEALTPERRDATGTLLIAEEALTPALIEHLGILLQTQPFWSDLPLLVLTPAGRETHESLERQRRRLPLGHLTLLERPLRPSSLLSAVEGALRARRRQYEVRDATAERDLANEALRKSEEQNRLILQSTRDCIKLLDLDGRLLSMNKEGQARLGIVNFGDVCGTSWFNFWGNGVAEGARKAADEALMGREGRFEGYFETSRGEATWWDVSVTAVRGVDGSIKNLLAVSREITERKLAEKALMQSEKLAAVGRLASSIAHEINNPLEAVTNLLYLASRKTDEPEAQGYLDAAEKELGRVSAIANQTLRFHRQSSRPQAVRAEELFSTVLSIYQGRLKNAPIRVETDFRTKDPVLCFESDVRQVLNNLVGNALDAMSSGGRLILRSHEVSNWRGNGRGLVLTVADTGVGMDEEVRAKAFEPFFTTKGIGGTGLGLWVSKEIAARHGGTLRIRSCQQPGKSGSVFRFFLPYAEGAAK